MNKETDLRHIEGLLFLSGSNGITIGELISLIKKDQLTIESMIIDLNQKYSENNHAFTILKTAQSYKLVTLNDDSEIYQQYAQIQFNDKISNSAMETLAIIAYNQPITRSEIEEKRGVLVGHNLKILLDKNLIKVVEIEKLTKAKIYGTTQDFLDFLGINSLEDLPELKNFAYEVQNNDEHQLFEDVDDFKEIRKRLMNSQNIVITEKNRDFEEIDEIKVPTLVLEEDEDGEITEDNSTK